MNYDPVLKEVMAEINHLLEKHDIGGSVILCSKTHTEFRFRWPKWSVVREMPNNRGFRILSKKKNFKSKKDQQRALEYSISMLHSFMDMYAMFYGFIEQALDKIKKKVDFTYTADSITPHRKQ